MSELNKVAVVLLRSVQESYPMLVTALLTKGADKLTLIVVKQALLDKEQRQGKGAVVTLIKETLHSKLIRGHASLVSASCRCGQAGHYQRDCCKLPSKSKQQPHLIHNHHQSTGKHHAEIGKKKERGTSDSGGQMFVANEVLYFYTSRHRRK